MNFDGRSLITLPEKILLIQGYMELKFNDFSYERQL